MAPKLRNRRPESHLVYYVVEITDWDWSYSFGINQSRHSEDPYHEFRHLHIKGNLIRPAKVKAEAVELIFLPDPKYEEANRQSFKSLGVGSLHLNGTNLQALISMPASALDPVMRMLVADRMKYVVMDGPPLRYRKALLNHYRIESTYEPEDLPLDE